MDHFKHEREDRIALADTAAQTPDPCQVCSGLGEILIGETWAPCVDCLDIPRISHSDLAAARDDITAALTHSCQQITKAARQWDTIAQTLPDMVCIEYDAADDCRNAKNAGAPESAIAVYCTHAEAMATKLRALNLQHDAAHRHIRSLRQRIIAATEILGAINLCDNNLASWPEQIPQRHRETLVRWVRNEED